MHRFFSRAARAFGWMTFFILTLMFVSAFTTGYYSNPGNVDDTALELVGIGVAGAYIIWPFLLLWLVCKFIAYCAEPEEEEVETTSSTPVSNLHTSSDGRWVSSSEERRLSNLHNNLKV
jgi:hypothetical protein